jgi:hypothetical protein
MVLAATCCERTLRKQCCDCGGIVPPCSCGAWEGSGNTLLYVTSVFEFAV